MFEKTLTDVVKGIRASKRDTALYISQCIAEIKNEISSSDMFVKANALQKLTFLQMMGYSMGYASFATIEVMSSPRFAHKRVGYLAASQGFKQDTEVILLATNLLKKELRCAVGGGMHGVYEAGLAINCLSNIVTEDLARDLLPELTNLTSHPQPYLRKKAILCLFKLFVKYPQGLRLTFERIQQCLEDSNSSVVSCSVNVITELSDKNPKNYLHLAPQFFRLLTESSNNWMLIKVVKLLGSLVPEEPRLARKLLEPLSDIVKSTQAKSLLYEAVRTITLCLPFCRKTDGSMPQNVPDIVDLCARTLRDFVEQTDQNLKYLGLVGFGSLMQSHPRVLSVPNYRPLILACLSDQDVTIRNRALDLLTGMASRKNLMELVTQLMTHVELAIGTYKHNLVAKIIEICSGEKYALLQDFSWYLDVLFQLGHTRGIETLGDLLRAQITDVALRVLPVRPYAVRRSMEILLEGEGNVSEKPYGDNGRGRHMMFQILPAIAWIIGEYSDLIREAMSIDPDEGYVELTYDARSVGTYHAIVQCLLDPVNSSNLPTSTQKVYIQSSLKVLAAASTDKQVTTGEIETIIETMQQTLPIYMQSPDVEVMERSFTAISLLQALHIIGEDVEIFSFDNNINQNQNGDLLGMVGSTTIGSTKNDTRLTSTTSQSVAVQVRKVSTVLAYLLKPAPMKPCGAKAQKKKRQTPNGVNIDLAAPVNLSLFDDLLSQEESALISRKNSLDSVCFTQQHPRKTEELSTRVSGNTFNVSMLSPTPPGIAADPISSFQKPAGNVAPSTKQRQGDPFYLASDTQDTAEEDERGFENRFGTIQLLDSDDENHNTNAKKQKKKKNDKDKSRKATFSSNSDEFMGLSSKMSATNAPELVVYESDEEEINIRQSTSGKRRPGKEFEGLAKVDLTTPLREDEVMPVRKHRVVPERPSLQAEPLQGKKKEKKRKKMKGNSKKNERKVAVGDLLDLGGDFGTMPDSNTNSRGQATQSSSLNTNPISFAFDDLLSLSTPSLPSRADATSTLMTDPLVEQEKVPRSDFETDIFDQGAAGSSILSKGGRERPWIKANLKSSEGIFGKILLLFQCHRIKQDSNIAASIVFRIENCSQMALSNLSLNLKGFGVVSFGAVSSGQTVVSDKVGPFLYSTMDFSEEVKGSLNSNGLSCSLKIHLPVSLQFSPEYNLTLEQVGQELVSLDWYSNSVKIDLRSMHYVHNVKDIVCSLVRAAEVEGSASTPTAGTYAARSSTSERVRILVKVKGDSVKVDIKSTNSSLVKAVAADIKRIAF